MTRIAVYIAPASTRSNIVGNAVHQGICRVEEDVTLLNSTRYHGRPEFDVAVFYGLSQGLRRILQDYRARRRAIFIDLGYWGRRKKTRWDGHHKMVLNSRHPTEYFQERRHRHDRFASLGIPIKPWTSGGDHILVAGMSQKAAAAEGLRAEAWERETIRRLRGLTKRPIVYRPKPNWPGARPIPGSIFQPEPSLEQALRGCHAVVTHHSNVAVDALLAGVPVFCHSGVASVLGEPNLELIETPRRPGGRAQWAADLAYCQYTLEEMENGTAWRMLKAEGLVP